MFGCLNVFLNENWQAEREVKRMGFFVQNTRFFLTVEV